MTKHEALKIALEALESNLGTWNAKRKAMPIIREALAQPEQEPVAVTAEMARAFHRAISDGPLGQADEFEIQTGLEAAFAHITTPTQPKEPEQECTRSHPHEEMSKECELRTEIARLQNQFARLQNQLVQPAVPQGHEQEPVPDLYVKDINGNFHLHKEKGHTVSSQCVPPSLIRVGENNFTPQLKEPEREPVAWMDADGERVVTAKQKAGMHESLQASFPIALGYTTPPQRKKLEQEPVAWLTETGSVWKSWAEDTDKPLYTTPPQRKPLTDEQRDAIARQAAENDWHDYEVIDAVEAAHGIKE